MEGSVSGDGGDDHPSALGLTTNRGAAGGMVVSMKVLGKPMGTNNFVTKLYQWVSHFPLGVLFHSFQFTFTLIGLSFIYFSLYRMISDPSSAQFIAWTVLGTSFVGFEGRGVQPKHFGVTFQAQQSKPSVPSFLKKFSHAITFFFL